MKKKVIVRAFAAATVLLLLAFFNGCEGILGDLPGNEVGTDSSTTVERDKTDAEEGETADESEDDPEPEGILAELIYAVNEYRVENSLAPLQWHDVLATAAQDHTTYMVSIEKLTYDSQYTGGTFVSDLMPRYGVALTGAAGETGHGFNDGALFFDMIIGHMANFFSDPDMTHHAAATAVGRRQIADRYYVTGDFVTYIMIKGSQEPDGE